MMKTKKMVVFGADDFAQLVKFYFEKDSEYEVCGFVVDPEYLNTEKFFCGHLSDLRRYFHHQNMRYLLQLHIRI